MKTILLLTAVGAGFLLWSGCQPVVVPPERAAESIAASKLQTGFEPSRIETNSLTGIVLEEASSRLEAKLNVYVDLLDSYDSRIKYPGRFRFELYDYVPRSSDPRGDRLILWPDVDLRDAEVNSSYWKDFLRTYKFQLDIDFHPGQGQVFILETTFITPRGGHLTNRRRVQAG